MRGRHTTDPYGPVLAQSAATWGSLRVVRMRVGEERRPRTATAASKRNADRPDNFGTSCRLQGARRLQGCA